MNYEIRELVKLPSSVQECDATGFNRSGEDWPIKNNIHFYILLRKYLQFK